jgi:hypothetical protein
MGFGRAHSPQSVSRAPRELSAARNCTRDEGGPFEFGDQEPISSHPPRERPATGATGIIDPGGSGRPCRARHLPQRRERLLRSGVVHGLQPALRHGSEPENKLARRPREMPRKARSTALFDRQMRLPDSRSICSVAGCEVQSRRGLDRSTHANGLGPRPASRSEELETPHETRRSTDARAECGSH